MKTKYFENQTVIITGASSGIGKALALQLASQGAWVALAARNEERLKQIAVDCHQLGGKAIPVSTDVYLVEADSTWLA